MGFASFEDDETGILREISSIPPAHYLFKIESFSLFSESGVDKIVSKNFQAGGHQWKITLFPKGKNGGRDNHVSMYLTSESISSQLAGKGSKAIYAFFKFFLFDQLRGKYLTVQGRVRRFDSAKNEWGVAKFISLNDLKVPTNGYLVNNTCLFGAEVFVTETTSVKECLSITKVANISGMYKWEINKFSSLGEELYSEEFVVAGCQWYVLANIAKITK